MATTLPTRPLGTTGMQVTTVGFGAWAAGGGGWSFGWGPQDDRQSLAAMRRALPGEAYLEQARAMMSPTA